MIESTPSRAKVFIDGAYAGITPYMYTDYKLVGSSTNVRIEREGFTPLSTYINKNEEADFGAIVGGLFFMVPYIWILKYKPVHSYTLQPFNSENSVITDAPQNSVSLTTKATKLRELKNLLDEKVITQDEFEKEKVKVLEEKE
jgi:hypothetical protein